MNSVLNHAALSRAKFAHKSYTVTCGYPKRVRSLVDDAKFDTQRNRELVEEQQRNWLAWRSSLVSGSSTSGAEDEPNEPNERAGEPAGGAGSREASLCGLAQLCGPGGHEGDGRRAFPRHIGELDQCHHLLIKYEPELDPTHPGFHDLEYRARRKEVAQVAFEYRHGKPIPEIQYEPRELATWRYIYVRLKAAYARYACRQHNEAMAQLEQHCGYSEHAIPQLEQVSQYLQARTGWRLRPVAGLLSARDFLASLAFRVFQTTQYIRHWGNPEHSVEPDCIHELMGHIPMLCDPVFAQFSQEIGLASLGASDEQIEKFATLYWFTVEFGLCRELGQLKCYGAGLLSSYGEMEHALESGAPELKEFVPDETALEQYDDAEYQVTYYVAESFEDAKAKIKHYAGKHLTRDFELAYDPYSCSIVELSSMRALLGQAEQLKSELNRLSAAIGKLLAREEASREPVSTQAAPQSLQGRLGAGADSAAFDRKLEKQPLLVV